VDSRVTVPGINLPYNGHTSPVTLSSHAVIRSQICGSAFKVGNPYAYIHNNIAHHEPQRKHTHGQDVKNHGFNKKKTQGCEKFSDQVKYQWFNHHGLHPLQTHVSIKEKSHPHWDVKDTAYKTSHTSALEDVVENSGSNIRFNSTATKHIAECGTGHRPSIHSAHRSGQTI
jgi:hypothetical protein